MRSFLPINSNELSDPDFVTVSGDAYVDHISFGHALVSRLVEAQGFKVGVIAQPVTNDDFRAFGAPKIAFLVSSGVVDSMVNNYTAAKKRRRGDDYSDEGKAGRRSDRALIVYCKKLKELFPDTPVIIGGAEASLRRFSHYDYWSDTVMRSVLYDSGADLLIFGMGEVPLSEICALLTKGVPLQNIKSVPGTCRLAEAGEIKDALEGRDGRFTVLSGHERVRADKRIYAKTFNEIERSVKEGVKGLIQKIDYTTYLVQNPPARAVTEAEMDRIAALPFMREAHPIYKHVPALDEVKFSITSHRGCFGECAFCALTYHQGGVVASRSADSIVQEAERLVQMPGFKGYIHDIGGPTANFYARPRACGGNNGCAGKKCVGTKQCLRADTSHREYSDILKRVRAIPGVKKVFVRSGVRFDFMRGAGGNAFFRELVKHHVSGQLKVAPEHVSDKVLKLMNKPLRAEYEAFRARFSELTANYGLEQYLVPYFISSHPGSSLKEAVELACYLRDINYTPEQVQDFYPTPSTRSTAMYYTGLNPDTMEEVYVARAAEEKAMQRALLQYKNPANKRLVLKALRLAGRPDLIGRGRGCLVSDDDNALKKH